MTIKLKKNVPLDEITGMLATANDWVKVVPNEREVTMKELTPQRSPEPCRFRSGVAQDGDGRRYLSAFTVGDQLLWGLPSRFAVCFGSCSTP